MNTTARRTPGWAYLLITLLGFTLAVLLWFLLAGQQGEPPPHRPPGDHPSPTYPTSPPPSHTPPEGGWPHG